MSIAQAALGTRISVPTVDGEEEVEIKPGTQPDTEIRLRGKGVPHLRRAGQRGDLHVLVDVVVPTKLSKKARDLLAAYARGIGRGGRRRWRRRAAREARAGLSDPAPAAGAWLELAVEADPEAVEAVSEIFSRVAPGGTSVEPAFELVDEGLGARVDPTRPAIVRAYLPARDRAAAERRRRRGGDGARPPPGVRPAPDRRAADAARRGGRLGRRLEGALPGHADRPAAGHPAHLAAAPGGAGRRGPDARSGDGLRDRAPPDDAAVPGRHRGARRRRPARMARRSSTSAAARGSWPSPRSSSGRPPRSASTPTRSPSRRRSPTRGATGSPVACAPARAACRAAGRRSTSCSRTSSPGSSCRSPRRSTPSCDPAGRSWRRASSSTARRTSRRRSRRPGWRSPRRSTEGDWVALEAVRRA